MRPLPRYAGSSQNHCLEVGDAVKIVKAGKFGHGASLYNGNHKVAAVPDETTFQYYVDQEPEGQYPEADFSAGYLGRIWQFGKLVFENNVIELALKKVTPYGRSMGIFAYSDGSHLPQFVVRQLVIRENVVRHVDNGSDPAKLNHAFEVWFSTENALIEGNIIALRAAEDLKYYPVIEYHDSGVKTFGNFSSDGTLIRAIQPWYVFKIAPEAVDLEEILLLSFLKSP